MPGSIIKGSISIVDTVNYTVFDDDDITRYKATGTASLTTNWEIDFSGTPTEGMYIEVNFDATVTLNGNKIKVFGVDIPDEYATKEFTVEAYRTASDWDVTVTPNFTESDIIVETQMAAGAAANIPADTVTAAMLDSSEWTRGDLLYGDASGDPAYLSVGGAATFLQSDGTDVSWVTISNDATVAAGGALTIANDAVDENKIVSTSFTNGVTGGSGSTIEVLPDTTGGTSLTVSANGVALTNDDNAPGNNYYYGTDSTGTKGWYVNGSTLWTAGAGTFAVKVYGASNIASGNYSFAAGRSNTSSNTYAFTGGYNNTASGLNSLCLGNGNTSAGTYSMSFGQNNNTGASGFAAATMGYACYANSHTSMARGYNAVARLDGMEAYNTQTLSNTTTLVGNGQSEKIVRQAVTTDATTTAITGGVGTSHITVPEDSVLGFEIKVLGVDDGTGVSGVEGDTFFQTFRGAIKNVNTATSLVGSVIATTPITDSGASTWTCTVSALDANDSLRIEVTGQSNKDISWSAVIETVIIGFGDFSIT